MTAVDRRPSRGPPPPGGDPDVRERRLIRQACGGDDRAFESLVHDYQDRVFGLVFRMMGNREEAEDLAQEVFISAHRAIATYRGDGRFYTWLYRIATNHCKNRIKYLRGRPLHGHVAVEDIREGDADHGAPGSALHGQVAGPEAMTEGARLEAAVQRELAALDSEHRLLIILRDVEGLPYHEILRITGLPEGTLKSRLHRARLALKEGLRRYLR